MCLKIMVVLGTRPEALKLCPLIKHLRENFNNKVEVFVCSTGQHQELLEPIWDLFDVKPDINLNTMQKSHDLSSLSSQIVVGVSAEIQSIRPSLVIVQGDTSSAFGGALAAFYNKVPVCHLEAGLRSYEFYEPYPEEVHRRIITQLSQFHLAPNDSARSALIRESVNGSKIYVVGNTLEDALEIINNQELKHSIPFEVSDVEQLVLVTQHRRENIGEGLINLCKALSIISESLKDVKVCFVLHPNPEIKKMVDEHLIKKENIYIIPSQRYDIFLKILERANVVVTDSGGLCEETAMLDIPTLITRRVTERQFLVDAGYAELVGNSTEMITERVLSYLTKGTIAKKRNVNMQVDGSHSRFIAHLLVENILPSLREYSDK